jgi:uncharacterized membrane protein
MGGAVSGPIQLPLPDGFSDAVDRGISNDGRIIVGYTGNLPVRWDGGANWDMTELAPYDGYEYGGVFDGPSQVAFDVRPVEGGWEAVGMRADAPMVWAFDGTEVTATQLANNLKARRINQDGEIVGRS